MRVTNSMMVNNLMRNLYKNYTKMDRAQQMLSSQKKFLSPSDDPIGVSRSLRLTTEILNMGQYKRNVDDSDSWLQSSEQVVNNIMSVMQRIRELTVQGSNETYSPDDRKKIADEIRELKDQIVGLGNTAYAGSYLFSGFKTDKPLLNKDGTYDLEGGILSIAESIEVNVGISDRMGINFVGQKLFGYMSTTTYDEYVLKGNGRFTGADLKSTNNEFVISYNGTDYTITMPVYNYNSFEGGKFVEDLNEKIAAIDVIVPAGDPPLKLNELIKASIEDGAIVLRGAREFQILSAGTTMDVKGAMGIDTDTYAALTKVIVSDMDDIDNPISQGAVEYLLKAEGSFKGITSTGTPTEKEFKIYYGDYEYTIEMDRAYGVNEDKEFIYDFNKKLSGIDAFAGHVKLYEKDGKFAIAADKKFTIDAAFSELGFKEGTSGLKSVRNQYGVEGAELKLGDNPVNVTTDNNSLYFIYGGKGYTITLGNKEYNGSSAGNQTFDDLINDIQAKINSNADLKGHVTVTGRDDSIQINADSQFKLTYGTLGGFSSVKPDIDSSNDSFNIKLGEGSPLTIKLKHGSYATIDDFTKAIQSAIDSNIYTKGRITVGNDGTNITFYSDAPISLSPVTGSGLLTSDSASNSDLMNSIGFNTAKQSILIDKRVESGAATQLIGMLDRLVKDFNENNTEGISKGLSRLDAHIGNLNAIRAEMGVKSNRLELTKNRIEDDNINIRGLLSKNEDVDAAEIIMELQMKENVYRAALSVGSKVITLSLVDFIR